jgi:hypothetical protein
MPRAKCIAMGSVWLGLARELACTLRLQLCSPRSTDAYPFGNK